MTETVVVIVIVLNVAILLASVWFNRCNNLTLKQRSAILNSIKELPLGSEWRKQYEAVSYEQHFTCLLLCRNPWKLYKVKNNEQA